MKKTYLALAAYGLLAAASACAQSSVSIYGLLDIGPRRVVDEGRGSGNTMAIGGTQASRLGFRGNEDLGGGLSVGFQLETAVKVDTGDTGTTAGGSTQFFDRMSILRVTDNALGEIRLGFDYTPTYNVWVAADPFYQTGMATNANVWPVALTNTLGAPFGSASKSLGTLSRARNSIAYVTPKDLGGFSGSLMVAGREGGSVATTGNNSYRSGRIGYASGPVDVAVGLSTTWNDITGFNNKLNERVAHAIYDFDVAKVALATRQFGYRTSTLKVYQVGLWVPVGFGLVKASLARATNAGTVGTTNNNGKSANQLSLGYEHFLSKRTVLYANVSRIANSSLSTVALPGGTGSTRPGGKSTGFDFGVRHSF